MIDTAERYELHPQVAIRPERFGALAYHFGNRRLTFLKAVALVQLVERLGDHSSVESALAAQGIPPDKRRQYVSTLSALETSEVIRKVPPC
jgi:putative mycofactocin binding protein MftB